VSHLVAYFGNEPENMACALFSARSALHVRSGARPDGWGLGFVQGGDVLLQKRPRAGATEVDLYALAKDLRADALVGRVGLGEEANIVAEDADPFRFRSWLFGSVGQISSNGFAGIRERVLESVPDFLRRNIRGKSPSEHIFHLFLAFMHDAGILDNASPPLAAVQLALRNSVVFLDRLLAGTGSEPMRIALVATNGRCFVGASCGHPLQYLHVEGISDCPVCHGRSDRGHDGRRSSHDGLRGIVVEADRATQGRAGWLQVPDRSALIVNADRVPHVVPLNGD
jgi:hypothetical protein